MNNYFLNNLKDFKILQNKIYLKTRANNLIRKA